MNGDVLHTVGLAYTCLPAHTYQSGRGRTAVDRGTLVVPVEVSLITYCGCTTRAP